MSKPDKQKLLDLADRVEALTEPSREVDAEIFNLATHLHYPVPMVAYENVYHAKFMPRWRCRFATSEPKETDEKLNRYTASIDAAVSLVPDGWVSSIINQFPDLVCFELTNTNSLHGELDASAKGKTEALARTAAALRALASEVNNSDDGLIERKDK